jgi:HEAT repeat protein
VPFLVELARWAPARRGEFAWMLGMLADPHHAYGSAFNTVRAAVAAHAGVFTGLLADADAQVRAAAAYVLAQSAAPAAPLWDRWAVEEEPQVRASLALALGLRDLARSAQVLAEAVLHDRPVVRTAAALALARGETAWPGGAVAVVVSAIDDGAEIEYPWRHHDDLADELLVVADDSLAAAVLGLMLRASRPKTRSAGAWGMTMRGQARRSAPALLLPLVRPLLDDPDQGVREAAVWALRRSGAASGQFADEVAAVATRYPQTAGQAAFTVEYRAVETLMLLGDPRWVGPFCAAAAAGHAAKAQRLLSSYQSMRWSPRVLKAVRRQLAQLGGPGGEHPAIPLLATVLGLWGSEAAAAIPELLAVLPHAGQAVARVLLRTGHRGPEMVAYLRALAEQAGDVEAAKGVWSLTGDPQPVISTLHVLLTRDRARVPTAAHSVTEVGSGLLPLVPVAQACLTGTAARTYPQRDVQVLAARVVSAATGNPAPALPTVRAVLAGRGTSASRAADLAADLAATQPAAVRELAPFLRDLLNDSWSRVAAARALWRLGTPPAELAAPLIAAIKAPHGGRDALPLLTDMQAVEAIADLQQLAERDERIPTSGNDDDLVWEDEILQDRLRASIAALRTLRQP